jgi:hypothetical protein
MNPCAHKTHFEAIGKHVRPVEENASAQWRLKAIRRGRGVQVLKPGECRDGQRHGAHQEGLLIEDSAARIAHSEARGSVSKWTAKVVWLSTPTRGLEANGGNGFEARAH